MIRENKAANAPITVLKIVLVMITIQGVHRNLSWL